MRHPCQTQSREALLEAVWKITFDPGTNLVDVYVGYLRRHIDRPGEPSLITTMRGVGYRFDPRGDRGRHA
jgi:DNA-binding response OmpR family regulator